MNINSNNYPLYLVMKDILLKKILTWNFLNGNELPSERELAIELNVSRMTIKRALKALENEGIIYRVHGKGTFINQSNFSNKVEIGDNSAIGLVQTIEQEGKKANSRVLSFKKTNANSDINSFYNNMHQSYYELRRVRYLDNEPFSYQITYLPYKDFIDAERYDFSIYSIYDYLELYHRVPITFKKTLKIVQPSDTIEKQLKLKSSDSLFELIYRGFDTNNSLVEVTYSYFNPNLVRFTYTTRKRP